MKADSLKSEFLIVGGVSLAGVYMALAALGVETLAGRTIPSVDELLRYDTAATVLLIGIVLGLSYVLGILTVQVTFAVPTEALIDLQRSRRLRELQAWDKWVSDQHDVPDRLDHSHVLSETFAGPTEASAEDEPNAGFWMALKHCARFYWRRGKRFFGRAERRSGQESALSLALTISRAWATETVTREYEYRRSNRQVFVGVLPGFALGGVSLAALLFQNDQVWWGWFISISSLFALYALVVAAAYQEKVAQSLLLDTALLHRWKDLGEIQD